MSNQADDLSDVIARTEVQLRRLGLSKNGLTARLMLKNLGLKKWEQLSRQDHEFVCKILESASPDVGIEYLQQRVYRLEQALIELVDGKTSQPGLEAIRNDFYGRLRQAADAQLQAAGKQVIGEK